MVLFNSNFETLTVDLTNFVLITPPFSELAKSTILSKEDIMKWFAYIELYCNPSVKNPFSNYEKFNKQKEILILIFGGDVKIPAIVNKCIATYEGFFKNFLSYRLLEAGKIAAEETIDFLTNVKFNERTKTGMLVHKPADVLNTIIRIKDANFTLRKETEALNKELSIDNLKNKNSRINMFEHG